MVNAIIKYIYLMRLKNKLKALTKQSVLKVSACFDLVFNRQYNLTCLYS